MGIVDKFKKAVAAAGKEVDEALTEEIEYQQEQGYMRKDKSEPLKKPKEGE